MKCQLQANQKSTALRTMFFVGLLISLLGNASNSFANHCSIDAIKQEIVRAMQHTNRQAITRYNNYNKDFINLIEEFLNIDNRESCEVHAAKFEAAITQFQLDIVDHPEFAHLRHLLDKLHKDLHALVNILRRYNNKGSGSVMNFISEFKNYEHLLSSDIKQKYTTDMKAKLKLLSIIRHRLDIKA